MSASIRDWAQGWWHSVRRDLDTVRTTPLRVTSVNPLALLLGPNALLSVGLVDAGFWLYADAYPFFDLRERLQSWNLGPELVLVALVVGAVYAVHVVAAPTLLGLLAVALFGPRRRAVEAAVFGLAAVGVVAAVTAAARALLWEVAESLPGDSTTGYDLDITLNATRRTWFAALLACLAVLAVAFLLAPWRVRLPTTWRDDLTAPNPGPTAQRGVDPTSLPTATATGPPPPNAAQGGVGASRSRLA